MLITTLWIQALYFLATGAWPIFHLESFLAVTGPKVDLWLVKAFGAIILPMGGALLAAAIRRRVTFEMLFLAAGSSLVLLLVDCIYVFKGVISPIYLADAAAQVLILLGLAIGKVRAGSKLEWRDEPGRA